MIKNRKRTIIFNSLLTIITLLLSSSCSIFMPKIRKYNLQNLEKTEIMQGLKKNYGDIDKISGKITISLSTLENRRQTSGDIYFSVKDTLYLNLSGLAGETELLAFVSPDSFFMENYYEKQYIYDDIKYFSFNRLTGINLNYDKIKYSFFGYFSIDENFSIVSAEKDAITIKYKSENKIFVIKLDNSLHIISVKSYFNEILKSNLDYSIKYDYFYSADKFLLPRRIVMKTQNPLRKLTIFYNSLEVNSYEKIDFKRYQK